MTAPTLTYAALLLRLRYCPLWEGCKAKLWNSAALGAVLAEEGLRYPCFRVAPYCRLFVKQVSYAGAGPLSLSTLNTLKMTLLLSVSSPVPFSATFNRCMRRTQARPNATATLRNRAAVSARACTPRKIIVTGSRVCARIVTWESANALHLLAPVLYVCCNRDIIVAFACPNFAFFSPSNIWNREPLMNAEVRGVSYAIALGPLSGFLPSMGSPFAFLIPLPDRQSLSFRNFGPCSPPYGQRSCSQTALPVALSSDVFTVYCTMVIPLCCDNR